MECNTLLSVLERIRSCSLLVKFLGKEDRKAFSRTCRQINGLCCQEVKALKLPVATCRDMAAACTGAVSKRFCNCTHVKVLASSTDELVDAALLMLPALSGLPRLEAMSIGVFGGGSGTRAIATLLELAFLRLTGLKQLSIQETNSWVQDSLAWSILGRATQLRRLAVSFASGVESPMAMSHLTALGPLSSTLQHLNVTGHDLLPDAQDYGFLSSLTTLVGMKLSLASTTGFSSVSLCTDLNCLELDGPKQNNRVALNKESYQALAQLKQLTALYLFDMLEVSSVEECTYMMSTVEALSHLQVLICDGLTKQALPILAKLTKLAHLGGHWAENDSVIAETGSVHSCASVQSVEGCGPIPFAAMRGVIHVCQWDSLLPSTISALAKNCRKLVSLSIDSRGFGKTSLPADAPVAERVAAVQSQASLEHLTWLTFVPSADIELAVLPHLTRLKALELGFRAQSATWTVTGIMHIGKMLGLQQLAIGFPDIMHISVAEAQNLITCLHEIPDVCLWVGQPNFVVFLSAKQAAIAAGLSSYDSLIIKINR